MSVIAERPVIKNSKMPFFDVPIESDIEVADGVVIPAGIVDLQSFLNWTRSDDFPGRYRIDYSDGRIWIDLSMEKAYSHNQVKSAFIHGIETILERDDFGRFFGDKMRVRLANVDVSTEPDGMFISYRSMVAEAIKRLTGRDGEVIEFEGAPDMILEIKSDFSEEKDEIERPANYHTAGVGEFWRVDARQNRCFFEVFSRGDKGYVPAEIAEEWQWSPLFRKWLCLVRSFDLLGDARFRLLAKD